MTLMPPTPLVVAPSITPPLTIAKPLLADFIVVCHQLPEDQRRQWVALSDGQPFDAEVMAINLAARAGPRWSLIDAQGTALAIGGYDMLREGVWQDWMIGTEAAWATQWRALTRHSRRIGDLMLKTEAHRLQTIALADRIAAMRWFRSVGLEYEGRLHGYGYGGEDCVMYARCAPVRMR